MVLAPVSRCYSKLKGTFPRVTHPCATMYCYIVRLACVKPAASVRSEPESNSQVVILSEDQDANLDQLANISLSIDRVSNFRKHAQYHLICCALDLRKLVIVHINCANDIVLLISTTLILIKERLLNRPAPKELVSRDTTSPAHKCSSHYQPTDYR